MRCPLKAPAMQNGEIAGGVFMQVYKGIESSQDEQKGMREVCVIKSKDIESSQEGQKERRE